MSDTVIAPLALRLLIESNNELLQKYQTELTNKVMDASLDCMNILGLNPADGWRIDINKMIFVKVTDQQDDTSRIS